MMWNIFVILVFSYLLTGLLDHITNIFRFFFIDSKDEDEKKSKKKLFEKK